MNAGSSKLQPPLQQSIPAWPQPRVRQQLRQVRTLGLPFIYAALRRRFRAVGQSGIWAWAQGEKACAPTVGTVLHIRRKYRALQARTAYANIPRSGDIHRIFSSAATRDPSGASHFWMRKQHIDLALNLFILPNGRKGLVLRDVVQLLQPVALRLG